MVSLGLYGQTEPYRTRYVEKLWEATGLTYSIPWLENPENTRQDEWRRARDLVADLQGTDPRYALDHAMSVLRMITGQSLQLFGKLDRVVAREANETNSLNRR